MASREVRGVAIDATVQPISEAPSWTTARQVSMNSRRSWPTSARTLTRIVADAGVGMYLIGQAIIRVG